MAIKLYFSPSDQTRNLYAVGSTNEAAQCRAIALLCVEAAARCGFEARTNTTDDSDESMENRVAESNAWGADAHIPIHTNAFNGKVQGAHIFYGSDAGEKLAENIMAQLAPIVPGGRHGVSAYNWYEIKYAYAPTAYVEVAFHDNPEEARWIIEHKRDIAEAIVKGCCAHFGVAYVDASPQQVYRVRKSWDDAASQIGAFVSLDNAFRARKDGYTVFDSGGNAVDPPQTVYTVASGDTLWDIAVKFLGNGTRWREIVAENGLTDVTIYPGQTLKLPKA